METTDPKIDPLKRVWVPIEKRNIDGTMSFRTLDKTSYVRDVSGVIRRKTPKVNGKVARQLRAQSRKVR